MEPEPSAPAHARPVAGLVADLATDAASGLTTAEAARRLEEYGPNVLREVPPESQWRRLLRQFADPLVYLLLAAVVISVGAWIIDGEEDVPLDAIVIAAIVVVNAAIGFLQERRADNAVAELRRMVASLTTVVRDGTARRVEVADLVPGDVVLVREGDVVPADGRIVEANGLRTAEAALTGESEPVDKTIDAVDPAAPVADRSNSLFAATSVVAGAGRMVVVGTGMATEVGAIADMLEATVDQPTPLEREVARVGRTLGVAVVILAAILVAATFMVSEVETAGDTVELMLVGVSLAVAAVPEGLPAVLSLVLALGVARMARRNALVKRLAFAETLGSTTVICSDKTGTLTQNVMNVRSLATSDGIIDLATQGPTTPVAPPDMWHDAVTAAIGAAALASDAEPGTGHDRAGDPTELALVDAATGAGIDVTALRRALPRTAVEPFDSIRKRMSTSHDTPDGVMTITKGAPDVILPLCQRAGLPGIAAALDDSGRAAWSATIDAFADQALRTMAVAVTSDVGDGEETTLLGVFGIIDPPRPEAAVAVATARAAGVRAVMITGDHPRTASRIAAEIGIGDGSPAVEGIELDEPGRDLDETAATTDVFARVAPRHKLQLVESLQRQGHVVAMTGDGVNDAPALKAADIGVAMGITGSDVSKGAADMILTDDNFATIVAAVEEGRSIFANVQAFMRYLLSSNMGEVLTMFLGVALATAIGLDADTNGVVAPLAATQILWINLLTDTGPALALGVDPVDHAVMARPPRRSTDALIDRTMLTTVATLGTTMAIAAVVMLDYALPGGLIEGDDSLDVGRTGAFTVLVMAQLFNAFATRSENRSAFSGLTSNPWLLGAVAVSFALQVLVVHHPALNDAFSTTPLSVEHWLVATALASSVLWVSEVRSFVRRRRDRQ